MLTSFVILALLALVSVNAITLEKLPNFEVEGIEIRRVGGLKSNAWCGTCVNFMGQAINQLLNIILNVGVVGSCNKLCAYLPNSLEADVCNVLCDMAGIEGFIKIIQEADPDPIFYCQDLGVCGRNANAAGNITSVVVQPKSVAQGGEVEVIVTYTVKNEVATGELAFEIAGGGGSPFGTGELIVDQAVGTYRAGIKFKTTPSEQEPFQPGPYQVGVALCEGTCGSPHEDSKILAEGRGSFQVTGQ